MRINENLKNDFEDSKDRGRIINGIERDMGFDHSLFTVQSSPMLFSRYGHNIWLGDTYKNSSAFLILGGPSFGDLIKKSFVFKNKERSVTEILNYAGHLTMGVNNSPKSFRPNLWTLVDDPGNFMKSIWLDPKIQKFAPMSHSEKFIFDNETWQETNIKVSDCPNVLYYRRNEHFVPQKWLHEDTFNWGEHSQKIDDLGIKGSRSVMLVAIKLLYYLGIRKIFLLGCDFNMSSDYTYHFSQERTKSSVNGNNGTYKALIKRFEALSPYFEQYGLQIFNCNKDSGLQVFPYIPFEEAVNISTYNIPNTEIERTEGMYDRRSKEKEVIKKSPQISTFNENTTTKIYDEDEKILVKQTLDKKREELNRAKNDLQEYEKKETKSQSIINELQNIIQIKRKEFREFEKIKNQVWGISK